MLMGFMPMMTANAATARAAAVVTYGSYVSDLNALESNTMQIGTAADDRYVVVGVFCTTNASPSSVTVGGAATTSVKSLNYNDEYVRLYITSSPVPAGTTAIVDCNGMQGLQEGAAATWAIYGVNPTATATLSDSSTGTSSPPTGSIVIPARGVMIAIALADSPSATFTWATGPTEHFDADGGGSTGQCSGASEASLAGVTRTVTADQNLATDAVMVAAAWGPA